MPKTRYPGEKSKRNIKIFEDHKGGISYNDLAKKYKLTLSRIGQIIKREYQRIEGPCN